jgi:hypothetical protein
LRVLTRFAAIGLLCNDDDDFGVAAVDGDEVELTIAFDVDSDAVASLLFGFTTSSADKSINGGCACSGCAASSWN